MKRKTIISIFMFILLIGISNKSFGAIEIKPGTTALMNIKVTESYLQCKGMNTTVGESLYGASSLLPHLATNSDWGAVSYLSNSAYGTSTEGKNKGTEITINSVKYYSTNGNVTGVMNWGAKPGTTRYTQTAGLVNPYDTGNATSSYVTELYNNGSSTTGRKFVDYINPTTTSSTKGMAMQETDNLFSARFHTGTSSSHPISIRSGLFSGDFGTYSDGRGRTSGAAYNEVTFRPVIWNK